MLTKEAIVELLKTDDKALCRALVLLNERQTVDEQASEATRYHNGRGFRPCHAKMGTSMANQIKRKGRLELSIKQLEYWRKPMACGNMKIGIYWKQLQEEAEKKAAAKKVATGGDLGLISNAINPVDSEGRSRLHPDFGKDVKQIQLEIAVGEVMDSDDEKMIAAAQADLDAYMEQIRSKGKK